MQNTRLPYVLRINPVLIIFSSLLLIIIPFLIWSNYAELEQKSSTHGIVIATAKTQKIQAAIDGVIDNIKVHEGQRVKKGELLISLEKEQNKAALDAIKAKVASLEIKLHRLNAEVYNQKLNYSTFTDSIYLEFIKAQTKLFHLRKKALDDEVKSLESSLKIKQEELALNKPLVEIGDLGKMKLLSIQKEITELKGKILNIKNKYFQTSQEEMARAEEELSINKQTLAEKAVVVEKSDIYAYMDAIVKDILITTKGAKVRPGDVILELLPLNDELIIEAKLTPIDISYIKTGQKAYVKFDTYDFSIYGMFEGKVLYVSPDSILEKTNKGDEYYFKVHIRLDKDNLISKNGEKIEVTPGMGAEVNILTGTRTVMNYLAKPIIKTLDNSFIER